ncbi:MAG: hypothetical protein H6714_07080 [Myxococcales bacterium]|nr:hypothetical protein [Myxococcales bacterium]
MGLRRHAWLVCVVLGMLGCAGADTHQLYRDIQIREAQVSEALLACGRSNPTAPFSRAVEKRGCHASQHICDLADDLDEADAQIRCERARRACHTLERCRRLKRTRPEAKHR